MKGLCKIPVIIILFLSLCSCHTNGSTIEQSKTQDGDELAEMKTNDVEKFVEFMPDNVLNLLIENDVFGIQTKTANDCIHLVHSMMEERTISPRLRYGM